MNLNFAAALAALGVGAAFRIANEARVAGSYLFQTFLPERKKFTYNVTAGNMTVRTTMAGLVGMDSPYPPGGLVELTTFLENTAKIAIETPMTEQAQRELQDMLLRLGLRGDSNTEAHAREALNFLDKVIVQALIDVTEWLRGQALLDQLNWTFGGKTLQVTYGVPTLHKITRAGADGYGGTTSKFWTDLRTLRSKLKGNVRAIVAHSETIDMIRYNTANNLAAVSDVGGVFRFRKLNANGQFTADAADVVEMIAYDLEAEILDLANPGATTVIPFMPRGKILGIGQNTRSGYQVGAGSTPDPLDAQALGYTHLAPTVEGGVPGRWAQMFTPENQPWQLRARGAQNVLPVVENPEKIVVLTTDMV